jgi:cytochrome c oxidase subunit III
MSPRDTRIGRLPDGAGDDSVTASALASRIGLWLFMGVVTVLFSLFAVAYLMRMGLPDWRALPAVPWQLWLSTCLLAAGSIALQFARTAAMHGRRQAMALAFACGCAAALAFLAVQLWAWQRMVALNYAVGANPANSFFYLITGLHGVHVAGGLVAGAIVAARLARGASLRRVREGVALCAQYWHFLLVLWLAVFGLLFFVTPEFVDLVCSKF